MVRFWVSGKFIHYLLDFLDLWDELDDRLRLILFYFKFLSYFYNFYYLFILPHLLQIPFHFISFSGPTFLKVKFISTNNAQKTRTHFFFIRILIFQKKASTIRQASTIRLRKGARITFQKKN